METGNKPPDFGYLPDDYIEAISGMARHAGEQDENHPYIRREVPSIQEAFDIAVYLGCEVRKPITWELGGWEAVVLTPGRHRWFVTLWQERDRSNEYTIGVQRPNVE